MKIYTHFQANLWLCLGSPLTYLDSLAAKSLPDARVGAAAFAGKQQHTNGFIFLSCFYLSIFLHLKKQQLKWQHPAKHIQTNKPTLRLLLYDAQ